MGHAKTHSETEASEWAGYIVYRLTGSTDGEVTDEVIACIAWAMSNFKLKNCEIDALADAAGLQWVTQPMGGAILKRKETKPKQLTTNKKWGEK